MHVTRRLCLAEKEIRQHVEIVCEFRKIVSNCYLHVTVPSNSGKRMLFNRTSLKFFLVETLELSWTVELCCFTTCCSCFCLVFLALWVLCVLCSRYSSEAWNNVLKTPCNIQSRIQIFPRHGILSTRRK